MTRKNATKTAARERQAQHGGSYAAHRRIVEVGSPPKTRPWICSQCKRPIAKDEGYVLVMDAESFGWPQEPTPDELPGTEDENGLRHINVFAEIPPNKIAFDALHRACDPHPNTSPYVLEPERFETLEAWTAVVHHMCDKRWMGKYDIRKMLAFWFENRGENIHRQG